MILARKIMMVLLSVFGLSACVSDAVAPLGRAPSSLPSDYHQVQKGETVYAIALRYGLDYRQLVEWNNIEERFLIYPGQMLRLSATSSNLTADNVQSRTSRPKTRRISGGTEAETSSETAISEKPLPPKAMASARTPPGSPPKSSPPKRASSTKAPASSKASRASRSAGGSAARDTTKKKTASRSKRKSANTGKWRWPSRGKLVRNFVQSGNRGLDISDRFGAPVYATATGRVVYTGSGLRGYGKLIIIKHNQQYLSAYGNNDRMLVKEGDKVKVGQKIAEMGRDSANRALLHFEIRKGGKPVDPARYLTAR